MSVITQDGNSALMLAARRGMTEIVSLLLKARAKTDLQNKVHVKFYKIQTVTGAYLPLFTCCM